MPIKDKIEGVKVNSVIYNFGKSNEFVYLIFLLVYYNNFQKDNQICHTLSKLGIK